MTIPHPAHVPEQFRSGTRILTIMMGASLLLHVAAAVPFLLPRHQGTHAPTAVVVDLNLTPQSATVPGTAVPMAAPVPAAAATVAPPAAATAPVAPPSPPTPYDELRDSVRAAQNEAETNPDALHEISFGLGMTSGYFSPLAEGKSLRPEIREYYLTMLRQINERWWRENRERTGRGGVAVFNVMIARDGTIIQQELARSSGNRELDDAMGRTLKAAGPFPPLPGNFRDDFFRAPLRFVPPLNLMAPASNAAPGAA